MIVRDRQRKRKWIDWGRGRRRRRSARFASSLKSPRAYQAVRVALVALGLSSNRPGDKLPCRYLSVLSGDGGVVLSFDLRTAIFVRTKGNCAPALATPPP